MAGTPNKRVFGELEKRTNARAGVVTGWRARYTGPDLERHPKTFGDKIAVVGLAIVTETAVAGSATGVTDLHDVEAAVRFAIETAKDYGRGIASFADADEVARLQHLYGSMAALRTVGSAAAV